MAARVMMFYLLGKDNMKHKYCAKYDGSYYCDTTQITESLYCRKLAEFAQNRAN